MSSFPVARRSRFPISSMMLHLAAQFHVAQEVAGQEFKMTSARQLLPRMTPSARAVLRESKMRLFGLVTKDGFWEFEDAHCDPDILFWCKAVGPMC